MKPGGLYKGDPPPLPPGAYKPRSLRFIEAEKRPDNRKVRMSTVVCPNGPVAATCDPRVAAAMAQAVLEWHQRPEAAA